MGTGGLFHDCDFVSVLKGRMKKENIVGFLLVDVLIGLWLLLVELLCGIFGNVVAVISKSSAVYITVFCVYRLGDKIASVNGISFTNVSHATAISVLKDSGQTATLVCVCTSTTVCL